MVLFILICFDTVVIMWKNPAISPAEITLNKLPRKMTPQNVNRLSELRKIFELKTDEDNLPSMKTASITRKEVPPRKTTMPEDNQPHLRCDQDRMNNNDVKFEVKFRKSDTVTARRPDAFVTPLFDVPPGSPDTSTTAVQEPCTTLRNENTSSFPRRQECLLYSAQKLILPVVVEAICASQAGETLVMTSQGGELYHQ